MYTLFRRLRNCLRRRSSYQYQLNNPKNQSEGNKKSEQTRMGQNNVEISERRPSSSPPALPKLKDRGPPTANRYPDTRIFRNSVIVEADPGVGSDRRFGRKRTFTNNKHSALSSTRSSGLRDAGNKTPKSTRNNNLGLHQLESHISYGKESAKKDLIVMTYVQNAYDLHPNTPILDSPRFDTPLSPGTREYDDFMDFPYDNVSHTQQVASIVQGVIVPLQLMVVVEEEVSSVCSEEPTVPTWNACLNNILRNEHMDQAVRDAVRERVHISTTTNGNGRCEPHALSTTEARLAPNFSRPVVGSGFYDRVLPDEACARSMTDDARIADDIALLDNRLDELVFESSTADIELGPVEQVLAVNLPNGVTSPLQSSSTSTTTEDSFYRAPTPPSEVTHRADEVISDNLSPVEIESLRNILADDSQMEKDILALSPSTRASIVRKLYNLIISLQDRIYHLEEILLPQLGEILELKTRTIDALIVEVENLKTQVTELKITVDLGSCILQSCWAREYEMWKTLMQLQERQRSKLINALYRLLLRSAREGTDRNGHAEMSTKRPRLKKELNALVSMAEQNLGILREDVDDIVMKAEACKRHITSCRVLEPEEGSWRDV